jgi:hypothetical protein
MTKTTKKFSLIVEIDLQTLSDKYIEGSETEPVSLQSMIEYECQWIQDSGIHLKEIQEINFLYPSFSLSDFSTKRDLHHPSPINHHP